MNVISQQLAISISSYNVFGSATSRLYQKTPPGEQPPIVTSLAVDRTSVYSRDVPDYCVWFGDTAACRAARQR